MDRRKIMILSTRSLDESTIKQAASDNVDVDALAFIKTEPISSVEIQQEIEHVSTLSTTVVFTSVNAVEAVAAELAGFRPDWQIFCIAHATCQAVEKHFGKNLILGSSESAHELADTIISSANTDEVIFFCGDQRRNELIDRLTSNQIDVNEIVVYQTVRTPHIVEKKYDGILFFSPSAVQSFFQKNKIDDNAVLFAIGDTTASELRHYSSNKIIVSNQPDKKHLLRNVIRYFEENPIHH